MLHLATRVALSSCRDGSTDFSWENSRVPAGARVDRGVPGANRPLLRSQQYQRGEKGGRVAHSYRGKNYTLLRNLLAPTQLSDLPLQQLKDALQKHFEPKRVVIAERSHFYRRDQAPGESLADFMAKLRRLSTHCRFRENQLEEALCDRLVCGLRSETIQHRLLTISDLTFTEALKTAQGMEAAERNAQQLKAGTDTSLQFVTS